MSSAQQADLFRSELPLDELPPLPPLPARIKTHEDEWVDVSTDVWRMARRAGSAQTRVINLNRIWKEGPITPRAQQIIRHYMARRVETVKPDTVHGDLETLQRFLRWTTGGTNPILERLDWKDVDDVLLRRFLAWGMETPSKGNDFARLRALYRWAALVKEFPDFDAYVQLLLTGIRAPGNDKGKAVRGWKDDEGPFNLDEYSLILDGLKKRAGTRQDRVVVRTFLELGARPMVLSLIRAKHLHRIDATIQKADGSAEVRTEYWLDVPVLKGRSAKIRKWKRRAISSTLGRWLEARRESYRKGFGRLRDANDTWHLFNWVARAPNENCGKALKAWAEAAELASPRTGKRLLLTPRRFRYTLGTFLAMQGHSRVEIAEALDHTDLQNVEVYIDAAAGFMAQLSAPIERALGPAIRRFLGHVAAPAECGAGGAIPADISYLPDVPMVTGSIGWCGRDPAKTGLCRFAHPLACYGCRSFTAFRNGPHREIGDALERLISNHDDATSPLLMGQLRTSLAAVRELETRIASEEAEV